MHHDLIDQRSLAMHRLAASKIRQDHRLFEQSRLVLEAWRQQASPNNMTYLNRWDDLFRAGIDACLDIALADTEEAKTLRQASPLACLLSPEERGAILREWRLQNAAKRA